ncbi:MAG: hypothetical protein QOE70_3077 [Chthoniobacter sp.]|jgi:hypothetical protein|nr:hypothetical protein [Chthoniobacter sp.]
MKSARRKRIVVMGFMAGCPIAGVIWQHIHYIVGLQRLGHEVYYVEDSARLPYDPTTYEITNDYGYALRTLAKLASQFGFEDRWAFCARYLPGEPCAGLTIERVRELYRTADAICNVCGTQEMNDDLLQSERILYVESDPGVEQIRVDKGEAKPIEYLSQHDSLFTFGENIGTPECPIPTHQFQWLPTRQPVVTDLWNSCAPTAADALFTSVANWNTSEIKDIEWRGDKYLWSKSLEFLKFDQAPARAGEPFELATGIRDAATRDRLTGLGWRLTSPDEMSIDWDLYRGYLQRSKGEFTVAKDQYVRLNTGWFSDRSACYLASGRPVITQETGFTRLYGGQRGLFAFRTLDDIAEAVREINADYAAHCRAASEVAAEYFEATKVLASLLDRAGV